MAGSGRVTQTNLLEIFPSSQLSGKNFKSAAEQKSKQTNKRTNERRLLANLENSEQRAPFFRREKKKSTGVTSDDERRDVVDDDDEVADITQRRDARNTLSQLVDFRSKFFLQNLVALVHLFFLILNINDII